MEDSRKRSERDHEDLSVYFTGKRPRTTSEMLMLDDEEEEEEEELMMMITAEEEEDLLAVGFPIQEEMVKQVMKVLEDELRFPNKTIKTTSSSSSASYFTINNNNEESCGPSFSDSSSTVMASMDIGSINIAYLLNFSEKYFSSSSHNSSLILPEASTNAEHHFIFPPRSYNNEQVSMNEVVEIINGGDLNQEEESDDEWIDRVLNEDLLHFDDDDDCLV